MKEMGYLAILGLILVILPTICFAGSTNIGVSLVVGSEFSYTIGTTTYEDNKYITPVYVVGNGYCEFELPTGYVGVWVYDVNDVQISDIEILAGPKVRWFCANETAPYEVIYTLTETTTTGGGALLAMLPTEVQAPEPILPEPIRKEIEKTPIHQLLMVKFLGIRLGEALGALLILYFVYLVLKTGFKILKIGVIGIAILFLGLILLSMYGGV